MNSKLLLIKKSGQLVAAVGLTLSFSMNAYAASQAGSVALAAGQVKASVKGADARDLKRKDPVNNGDTLSTGDGSFAQIRFIDGGYVSLKENAELTVDEVAVSEAKGKDDSFVVSLSKGSVRAISGQIGKVNKTDYVFKTPLGNIGIRGTTFSASSNGYQPGPNGPLDMTRPQRVAEPQIFAQKVLDQTVLGGPTDGPSDVQFNNFKFQNSSGQPGAEQGNKIIDVVQVTSGGINLTVRDLPPFALDCCDLNQPNSAILLGPPDGQGLVEVYLFRVDDIFWNVPLEGFERRFDPVETPDGSPRLNSPGDNFGLKNEVPPIIDTTAPDPIIVDPVPEPAPAPAPDPVVPDPAPAPVDPTANQGIFDNIPTGQVGQGQGLQGVETPPDETNQDIFLSPSASPPPTALTTPGQ